MNRRYEIVSQWQERLVSAEHLADGTARFRWIHLARVRLYRFLLSCYGSGQWRSGMQDDADASPAVHHDEVLPLAGKPPKSAGAIQSVLKSVHNAQDHPPPVGPLTAGLNPETYMAVTDSDARIDVERCETFLLDNGFHPRVVGRGRRMTVEVPYCELREAEALVDSRREMLRPRLITTIDRLRHNNPLPSETQALVVGLMLVAPIVGLALMLLGMLLLGGRDGGLGAGTLAGLLLTAFIIVTEISLLWYFFAPRWPGSFSLATRRRIAMAVFWICVGVPAALVIAVAIVVFRSGPVVQSLMSPAGILAIVFTVIGLIAISLNPVVRR